MILTRPARGRGAPLRLQVTASERDVTRQREHLVEWGRTYRLLTG